MTKKKAAKKSTKAAREIAVLVTTAHRGVFFGYCDEASARTADPLTLRRARLCTYWSAAMRGVFGLAVGGPDDACRIGPAAESLTVRGITSVTLVTPEAAARWEAQPWGR